MVRTEQIYVLGTITTDINTRWTEQVKMLVNCLTGWKTSLAKSMNGPSLSFYRENGNKTNACKYCFNIWGQGKKFVFESLKCTKYWEVVNSRNQPLHECICPFFVAGFQKEDGSQGYDSSTFSSYYI